MKLNIKTPLEFLKDLRSNAIVEIEGNLYRSTVTIRGKQLNTELFGNIKVSFARVLKYLRVKIFANIKI